ncbi:MAG: PorT family protein [Saprospiraceae bacterium]|nr:PorT family protein [Saprospiraceae bacterium]
MRPRHLFFLLLILSFATTLQAQRKSWAVGVQIGENFSTLTGESDYDFRPGWSAGIHLSHYLLNDLVIRLEVNIDDRGANLNPSLNTDPFGANEYRLTYLSMPILLRYSTDTKFKFIAGGGLSVDVLLADEVSFGDAPPNSQPDFRRFNADLVGCLGGAYPITERFSLTAEGRTLWSMQSADRNAGEASRLGRFISWEFLFGLNFYL